MTELTETVELTQSAVLPRPKRFASFARTAGGIAAIGVKELRGRMRGRRAFAIITIYLVLLGGFALMAERLFEANAANGFGGTSAFASAQIGQGIFAAVLMLMTLQVVFLASSATAGSISLEREKQTLELLIATPISSLAIVLGKLLSALVYVFLLIAASIPLMAVVFVYGGVGPEDVLRGYIVLIATALGLGSFGLLCSSLVKRTTAATAITIFGVLAVTIGSIFVLGFWQAMGSFDENGNREGLFGIRSPAILAYLNPFVAQADVMCGTESTFGGGWCSVVNGLVPSDDGIVFLEEPMPMPAPMIDGKGFVRDGAVGFQVIGDGNVVAIEGNGVVDQRVVAFRDLEGVAVKAQVRMALETGVDVAVNDVIDPAQVQPFDVQRDFLWPKTVATWLILSAVFLLLSVQAVSPTRRWHLRRGGRASPRTTE
jgi:ABC-2 type transport system permease protein